MSKLYAKLFLVFTIVATIIFSGIQVTFVVH